jgi:hypothetical protein
LPCYVASKFRSVASGVLGLISSSATYPLLSRSPLDHDSEGTCDRIHSVVVSSYSTTRVLTKNPTPPRLASRDVYPGVSWEPLDTEVHAWQSRAKRTSASIALFNAASLKAPCVDSEATYSGRLDRRFSVREWRSTTIQHED